MKKIYRNNDNANGNATLRFLTALTNAVQQRQKVAMGAMDDAYCCYYCCFSSLEDI